MCLSYAKVSAYNKCNIIYELLIMFHQNVHTQYEVYVNIKWKLVVQLMDREQFAETISIFNVLL